MPPLTKKLAEKLVKGTVAIAISERLAFEKLAIHTDAQKACVKQQDGSQCTIPSGGLMTVEAALQKLERK